MQPKYKKIVEIVSSKRFFWVVLALFIFQAVWFAISARFPMAFDENFHLGIIQIYAHQWTPFFAHQPSGPIYYGQLTHDPSYLFHYLMSFPYRFVSTFTSSFMVQVIVLRFIDIALFAWGLVLFRKLLLKVKDEPALINFSILFFVFIPIVPFLAAQINYDNLVFPLTALSLLWTVRFVEKLRTKQQLSIPTLIGITSVGFLASLTSFVFLPILTAIAIYLVYVVFKFAQAHPRKFKNAIKYSWRFITPLNKVLLLLILLISSWLFINAYGVNLVKYNNVIPQCNQVLSVSTCQSYQPWARNYADAQMHIKVDANPLRFSVSWIQGMYERLVFAINGPGNPDGYANPAPLPVLNFGLALLSIVGLLLFIRYGREIVHKTPYLKLVILACVSYLLALWGRNYHDFIHLGAIVAINGRYLVFILIPIIFMIGLSYKRALKNYKITRLVFAVVVLLVMLQGGGFITFINTSNSNWYWPNDRLAKQINNDAQSIVQPLLIN